MSPRPPSPMQMAAWLKTCEDGMERGLSEHQAGRNRAARKAFLEAAEALFHAANGTPEGKLRESRIARANELLDLAEQLPDSDSAPSRLRGSAGEEGGDNSSATSITQESRPLAELLTELDELIGLESVKREVRTLAAHLEMEGKRQALGLPTPPVSRHLVFTGNPGTGKTTVARLIAGIYRSLGILERGHLVETDSSGLIAEYQGQTAPKTRKVVESALGGVLFIDEAYALASDGQRSFGPEAIATLVKMMEDHRKDIVVVVAGYSEPMETFLRLNPGLKERFGEDKRIYFPDYTPEELLAIFNRFCSKYHYSLTPAAQAVLENLLAARYAQRDETFANARMARNLFERAISRVALRLSTASTQPDAEQLSRFEAEDLAD